MSAVYPGGSVTFRRQSFWTL